MEKLKAEELLNELLEDPSNCDATKKVLNAMTVNAEIISVYVELHMATQVLVKKWNNNQEPTNSQFERFVKAFAKSSLTLQKHTKPV